MGWAAALDPPRVRVPVDIKSTYWFRLLSSLAISCKALSISFATEGSASISSLTVFLPLM